TPLATAVATCCAKTATPPFNPCRFRCQNIKEQGRSQKPLADTKFCVQDGAASGTANGIMSEQYEFVAEDGTGAQSANRNCHASTGIPVTQCLRPVRLGAVDQGMLRRTGQLKLLRFGFIVFPRRDDILFACMGA